MLIVTALIVVERQNASLVLAATWSRSVTKTSPESTQGNCTYSCSHARSPNTPCHAVAGGIH